ncbi:MAG: hypothetical protein JNN04_01955 [Cyclobacteriaceae bacterium]|nr:hypothetical protein [Cyclobacteriaceae bacterium]
MKKTLLILSLFAPLGVVGQSTDCPLSSAITVDGKPDEWPMNWVEHEEKIFSYNICADDQNLYVRVKTDEFYTKRKMGAFGFTLWFDPSGKKKKTYGLKFPAGGAEAEERMGQINDMAPTGNTIGEKADFQKTADRMLIENLEILELIGLTKDPITATRSGITNGIKVAIDMDATGAYTYEVLIPFKSYRLSRAQITDLSVGFETGKYVMPKQKPTTKNSPVAGADLSPSQLSRMQGYGSLQGNPKLTYPTDAWVKVPLKK